MESYWGTFGLHLGASWGVLVLVDGGVQASQGTCGGPAIATSLS